MRETEIKFIVHNIRALEDKLRAAGFREKTPPTHEMNVLYDFPTQSLSRSGQLLRIRRYGRGWRLTHKAKGKIGRHKSREETETTVADGAKLAAIFNALGLVPIFGYEKFRSTWSDQKGEVVIDRTPIGDFAEIEGKAQWIDKTARKLGVRQSDYITQNYAGLFYTWKRTTGSAAEEMTFKAIRKRVPRSKAQP
jgi:predicted adenylyl cyclase CyaB